jgi:hypothetical protein
VYNGSVSQEEVYESSVHPLLTTFLDGYNVTGQSLGCFFHFAITSPFNPLQSLEKQNKNFNCVTIIVDADLKDPYGFGPHILK